MLNEGKRRGLFHFVYKLPIVYTILYVLLYEFKETYHPKVTGLLMALHGIVYYFPAKRVDNLIYVNINLFNEKSII